MNLLYVGEYETSINFFVSYQMVPVLGKSLSINQLKCALGRI